MQMECPIPLSRTRPLAEVYQRVSATGRGSVTETLRLSPYSSLERGARVVYVGSLLGYAPLRIEYAGIVMDGKRSRHRPSVLVTACYRGAQVKVGDVDKADARLMAALDDDHLAADDAVFETPPLPLRKKRARINP
jgi:hypothetical protein